MARRRHRKSYHGYGKRGRRRSFHGLPSLSVLKESVPLSEAALGLGVGLASSLGALYALNKLNASRGKAGKPAIGFTVDAMNQTVPAVWQPFIPFAGGLLVGLGGYFAFRKNKRKAAAILVGSALGGLLTSGFQLIKAKYPAQFGDYVRVRLAGYGNVLINQGALGNLIVATPGSGVAGPNLLGRTSMGGLAHAAMSPAARAVSGYLRARIG